MARVIAVVAAAVFVFGTAGAVPAEPVKGGRYVFRRDLGRDGLGEHHFVELELTLANDGRELAYPSGVSEDVPCGRGSARSTGLRSTAR
jgi:hypothetical protein